MSVNRVILCGSVGEYGAKIVWTEAGKPQTSFPLVAREGDYRTFIPVLVVGAQAERVAETHEPEILGLVDGKLAWQAGKTKDDGRLVVVCFAVEVMQAAAPAEVTP